MFEENKTDLHNACKKLKLVSSPTQVWERRNQHHEVNIAFNSV
jgi:hypothetical protein